jgi:hypothetical protein
MIAACGFFLTDPPEPGDPAVFGLSPADFRAVNPNTGTAPIYRSRRDAELTRAIYERLPVLVDRSDDEPAKAWPVEYFTMFHMTNDSNLFWSRAALGTEGAYETGMSRWRKGSQEWLPLYEGKMVQAFDHRAACVVVNPENVNRPAQARPATDAERSDPAWTPEPQFWIESQDLGKGLPATALGFKDVTSPTNERTMIAALLPAAGYGNTLPIVLADSGGSAALLTANFNALPFDFIARQKVQGQHLNWFIVEQLPVVRSEAYDRRFGAKTAREIVADHVLRLTYTAHDMAAFARDMSHVDENGEVLPPFRWDEAERRQLRARLDALYFHLYGVDDEADVRYILSTFPIVERKDREAHGCYLSAELIVWYMRAFAAGDTDAAPDQPTLTRAAIDRERRAAA